VSRGEMVLGGRRLARRRSGAAAAFAMVAGLAACTGWAQEPTVSITPRRISIHRRAPVRGNIRLDVNLTLVPVTVTDLWERPVTNLGAGAFRVFEDNIEQKIVSVFKEDGPVSVGFVFDTSSSMKKRIDRSIAAIRRFFESTAPGDEFFLVKFADQPTLATGFTSNPADILRDLSTREPQGWTALLDAIGLGVHEMKKAKNPRRALFVLTDGGDNDSRYTESEIKDLVMESDVRVYAIGIFERYQFLERLTAESGGRAYFARKLADLPEVVDRLSADLREEYILGYSSNNQRNDGKYRTLRVEVTPPAGERSLNVVWRRGYYAPPD
jgi:Ca-activated chloride channel homolog